MSYKDVITIEPGKRGGKPCIRGMRITVHDVLTASELFCCGEKTPRRREMSIVPTNTSPGLPPVKSRESSPRAPSGPHRLELPAPNVLEQGRPLSDLYDTA